ncbi:MAG: AsmA-like C-terminal region-containing protein [Bacteroidales bacterium]|jgi:hypothetical protein|nr:AsmA-like C-terminal region-containing protein [Bacteroidales bacterium]
MRKFKKILLWFFVSLLAILLIAGSMAAFYIYNRQDDIQQFCVAQINDVLAVKVKVEKMRIGLDGLYVSLVFQDVEIPDASQNIDSHFVKADYVKFNFNLFDLIKGKYILKKIKIIGADVNVIFYKNGKTSYKIWKSSEENSGNDFFLQLKNIEIKQSHLLFVHQEGQQEYSAQINKLLANADISSRITHLSLDANFYLEKLISDTVTYLSDDAVHLVTKLEIPMGKDGEIEFVAFNAGELNIEGIPFAADGVIYPSGLEPNLKISLKTEKIKFENLLKICPDFVQNKLNDFRSSGDIHLALTLEGKYSCKNLPGIALKCHIDNAKIFSTKQNIHLEKVKCIAEFRCKNLNNWESFVFNVSDCYAQLGNGSFQGICSVNNFENPHIILDGKYDIDFAHFHFEIPYIQNIDGQLIGNIKLNETFNSFDSLNFKNMCKANLEFQAFSDKIKVKTVDSILEEKILIDSILIDYKNNELSFRKLKVSYNIFNFNAVVNVKNLFNYVFYDKTMSISGKVDFEEIKLNKHNVIAEDKAAKQPITLNILNNIQLDIFANIIGLKYGKWDISEITTFIHKDGSACQLYDFSAKCFDGDIYLRKLEFVNKENGYFPFKFDGIVANINSTKLFYTMDNFEQDVVTDKNISGKIDADIDATGYYSWQDGLDYKRLNMSLNAQINDGKLKNLVLLKKLSFFINEETLMKVNFDKITNTIVIKNSKIIIPKMHIRSNAVDLDIAAEQYFSGEMDYKIKLALSELLSRKRREKRRQKALEEGEEINKNRNNIYVHITGTTDKPDFHYGLGKYKNVFDEIDSQGNVDLSNKIKSEIKAQKNQEKERQKAMQREQEKGNFVISFDDENIGNQPIQPKLPTRDSTSIKIEWEDE